MRAGSANYLNTYRQPYDHSWHQFAKMKLVAKSPKNLEKILKPVVEFDTAIFVILDKTGYILTILFFSQNVIFGKIT